jgi:hypothetical protein
MKSKFDIKEMETIQTLSDHPKVFFIGGISTTCLISIVINENVCPLGYRRCLLSRGKSRRPLFYRCNSSETSPCHQWLCFPQGKIVSQKMIGKTRQNNNNSNTQIIEKGSGRGAINEPKTTRFDPVWNRR